MKLGVLKQVPLREVWKNEASDFTTWLVKPENLKLLGETLDMELEPLEQESRVGKYSADILAKNLNTDQTVVIENQLEDSNHDHLGKCITYAAGKEAEIVIWIVKKANEEHRKAVEWLNEKTDDEIAFFLVEVEALKIGDSDVAPNFKIIASPNEWAKAFKRGSDGISETGQLYQRFWTEFVEYAKTRDDFRRKFKTTKPLPHNWMSFASFASGCGLSLVCNTFSKRAMVKVYVSHHSPFHEVFKERYQEIEEALGVEFVCGTAKDRTYAIVCDFDVAADKSKWGECFKWFCDTMLQLLPAAKKLTNN